MEWQPSMYRRLHFPFLSAQNRLNRLLGRWVDLDGAAERVDIIHPAEDIRRPATLFGQENSEDIRSFFPTHETPQDNRLRIFGGVEHMRPSRAFTVGRCYVGDTFALGARFLRGFGAHRPKTQFAGIERAYRELEFCNSAAGIVYFGHWLVEDCPTVEMRHSGAPQFFASPQRWGHTAGYIDRFGFDVLTQGVYWTEKLTIFDDVCLNSHKTQRLISLRDKILADAPPPENSGAVYIRRGATGAERVLANENELLRVLAEFDVEIVDSTLPWSDFMAKLRGRRVVISIEGSQASHAFLTMPSGGVLFVLMPDDRATFLWKDYADSLDIAFGFMVLRRTEDGYYIDPNMFRRRLEQALSHTPTV